MKKITLLLSSIAVYSSTIGQIVPTSYRGAFEPAPAEAWTNGWTNFTPALTTYPSTNTEILAGDITSDQTWTKNKVYELKGYVFVKNGATLTIEAGTIIRSSGKCALVITRGSKINAAGTKDAPIVFTSNKPALQRTYGDWAGIVLCGAAQHNLPLGVNATVEGDIVANHGGSDDDDNSGVLQYVRIEFPGQALSSASNSEINGLSLYSVGRGTVIDHIQVSYSGDDSYEWFGGAANAKYLIAYRGQDDDFDTDNGFRGLVQFGVGHRDPAKADASGSNGFESDNNAQGTSALPQTAATFSNFTIVGPVYNGGPAAAADFKRAAHVRRNSSLRILNSILLGYTDAGLLLDGRKTIANAVNGTLMFKNNFVANNTTNFKLAATSDTLGITSSTDVENWALNSTNLNEKGSTSESANLVNPFTFVNPDYRLSQSTGIEDALSLASTEKIVLFPNPATDNLQIALNSEYANATVTVQNAMGMTVASSKAFGESVKFDVSGFANGLYIVSVSNGGNSISKTLLINR